MRALKHTALAAILGAFLYLPPTSAIAAGPLLLAPWLLGGHVLGGLARLAAAPLVVASEGLSAAPPMAAYAPEGGYYGQPTYYAPRYYAPRPAYYGAPQAYYPPATRYPYYSGYSARRYYAPSRGYYAPSPRYPGYYGAQASYPSRGYPYRRG